ncbi:MAG: flavodoxin family protein [Dehalococcoidales bacterium]|nr:MAG: flavodoxin family protein [Dehalococcoidales bacterium]
MRITILNGNPESSNSDFDDYLRTLSESLESQNHEIIIFTLREMDTRYCIGCFGCWIKTPGECSSAADDSKEIRKYIINSELIIFASPVIMGFTSALLKRMHDKFCPLVLPYSGLYHEESHHHPRYDRYPAMGLLLQPDTDTDEEDIDIITEIYRRDSLNFHADLVFTGLTTDSIEKATNEINSL